VTDLTAYLREEIRLLPESGIVEAVNYGRDREGLIPLWAGESDHVTPQVVSQAAFRSIEAGETTYTYQRGIPELREALAVYHERLYQRAFSSEEFFVTGSGMQAIQISVQAIVSAGDEVVVPTPGWPNMYAATEVSGGRCVYVPLTCDEGVWAYDVEQMIAACTDRTRAIFINSPSNPSGSVLTREDLVRLRDFSRERGIWIISDEVYGRFFYEGDLAPSCLEVFEPEDRLIVVNTFSKNWAMTGWRVGWIVASPALGQVIENLIQYATSGVPIFSQRACIAALEEGEGFLLGQVETARKARDLICEGLSTSNRTIVAPPAGAFYLFFGVEGETDSRALAMRLIDEANVGLAPGSAFGPAGEGYLRLCFAGTLERLEEAVARLVPALA
jgi:aspartate/methionine/tyrosine aminotransferase